MEIRQREMVHMKDKERLKTDLELQKELNELKVDRHLQREEAKLRASYKSKDKTFEAIRTLITKTEDEKPRRSRSHTRRRSASESMSTTSSDLDFIVSPKRTRSRVISESNLLDVPPSPIKSRSGGVVAANPRCYRSRSTDNDRWIEHTPGQPVKSGTVFQPVMKKKKSVNRLTSADEIVNKASKYCLNLQQADGDGGVETKLYKGDVIPSRSGGAQVVFNDVEILKQVSPSNVEHTSPSKKRMSSSGIFGPMSCGSALAGKLVETYDEFDTVTGEVLADRCATGIGHQTGSKRSRRT
jgi:kinesin family protein 23